MKVVAIIIFISILIAGVVVALNYVQQPPRLGVVPATSCGLTVVMPLPASHVRFPLTVRGKIDNSRANETGCTWGMFEGQGGQARLLDRIGQVISGPEPIKVADWMAATTTFSVPLNVPTTANLVSGDSLIIELVPENPSDRPQTTHLDLPIVLEK